MGNNCEHCTGEYCAKKVSIFSMLNEDELKDVIDLIVTRKYKKGQIIFFEGDISDKLYIINQGKIKIFKYTKESKEQILYILSEGDFIGDMSLFKRNNFNFNAEALEDVSICTLSKQDFDNILRKKPDIALRLLEDVYNRLISLQQLVQTLSTKDVEARIAGMLLSFEKDFGTQHEDYVELNVPFSREEMANFIGITRETVSRKLTSMQDDGIIELVGNKKIIIKDMETLKGLM